MKNETLYEIARLLRNTDNFDRGRWRQAREYLLREEVSAPEEKPGKEAPLADRLAYQLSSANEEGENQIGWAMETVDLLAELQSADPETYNRLAKGDDENTLHGVFFVAIHLESFKEDITRLTPRDLSAESLKRLDGSAFHSTLAHLAGWNGKFHLIPKEVQEEIIDLEDDSKNTPLHFLCRERNSLIGITAELTPERLSKKNNDGKSPVDLALNLHWTKTEEKTLRAFIKKHKAESPDLCAMIYKKTGFEKLDQLAKEKQGVSIS